MDAKQIARIGWIIILVSYVLRGIIDLILVNQITFDPTKFGPYSIMARKEIYIAYNFWAILLPLVNGYALIKKQKTLFLITLLLLLLVVTYPFLVK